MQNVTRLSSENLMFEQTRVCLASQIGQFVLSVRLSGMGHGMLPGQQQHNNSTGPHAGNFHFKISVLFLTNCVISWKPYTHAFISLPYNKMSVKPWQLLRSLSQVRRQHTALASCRSCIISFPRQCEILWLFAQDFLLFPDTKPCFG